MKPGSQEWSFLTEAWKYALVLSGRESEATTLVSDALKEISTRLDGGDSTRTRRLLFSVLYRRGAKVRCTTPPESLAEKNILPFHEIEEPFRSAITLLYLGLFSSEHLSGIIGQSESELANTLSRARAALASKIASPA